MRRRADTELAQIRTTLDKLQSQRNAAVRQLKDVESELAQRTADLRHARHEIRMREAELEQAEAARDAALQAVATSQRAAPTPRAVAPPELVNVVADAAAEAERLSASLAVAADLLTAAQQRTPAPPAAAGAVEARQVPRRTPIPVRAGIMGDSAEAAEQLLRTPGAVLLVDGYNISHAVWWDQPIASSATASSARSPNCTLERESRSRWCSTAPRSSGARRCRLARPCVSASRRRASRPTTSSSTWPDPSPPTVP